MRRQTARLVGYTLALLLSVCLGWGEADAQGRRPRRSRRVTNPVVVPVAPPAADTTSADPQIISTAEQQAAEQAGQQDVSGQVPAQAPRRRSGRQRAQDAEQEQGAAVQRTVNDLSAQVNKLTEKLTQMEQQQRTLVDLERLSRAEQRAEALRTQLRDVQEKEGNLSARMEQIEYDLKPENIERSVVGYGSTRPEDARDARRRALESERTRARSQLDLLVTSRQRLETAIVNADLEVEKLRKRLDESPEGTPKTDTTENPDETEGTPVTTPTNTPAQTNTIPPG